ncbi:MAG: hypothetical protein NVSMB9_07060 [Isosphaeraceae bacterium]
MTRASASWIRRLGLLIEVVCMLGLLSVRRGNNLEFWLRNRVDPSIVLSFGLGMGLLIWAGGTVAMYWPERARSKGERGDHRQAQ